MPQLHANGLYQNPTLLKDKCHALGIPYSNPFLPSPTKLDSTTRTTSKIHPITHLKTNSDGTIPVGVPVYKPHNTKQPLKFIPIPAKIKKLLHDNDLKRYTAIGDKKTKQDRVGDILYYIYKQCGLLSSKDGVYSYNFHEAIFNAGFRIVNWPASWPYPCGIPFDLGTLTAAHCDEFILQFAHPKRKYRLGVINRVHDHKEEPFVSKVHTTGGGGPPLPVEWSALFSNFEIPQPSVPAKRCICNLCDETVIRHRVSWKMVAIRASTEPELEPRGANHWKEPDQDDQSATESSLTDLSADEVEEALVRSGRLSNSLSASPSLIPNSKRTNEGKLRVDCDAVAIPSPLVVQPTPSSRESTPGIPLATLFSPATIKPGSSNETAKQSSEHALRGTADDERSCQDTPGSAPISSQRLRGRLLFECVEIPWSPLRGKSAKPASRSPTLVPRSVSGGRHSIPEESPGIRPAISKAQRRGGPPLPAISDMEVDSDFETLDQMKGVASVPRGNPRTSSKPSLEQQTPKKRKWATAQNGEEEQRQKLPRSLPFARSKAAAKVHMLEVHLRKLRTEFTRCREDLLQNSAGLKAKKEELSRLEKQVKRDTRRLERTKIQLRELEARSSDVLRQIRETREGFW